MTNPDKEQEMARKMASKAPQTADVAISTETPCTVTRRNQIVAAPNQCSDNRVVDVSGFAQTDNSGQLVFRISDFICPAGETYCLPITSSRQQGQRSLSF